MDLSFFQSLILGFISGFAEVMPVSSQAHRLLFLKLFGQAGESPLLRLFIHAGTVGALHFVCRGHIVRMMRAYRLSLVPKKRRKRPLDTEALMDFNLLKTALIPVILAFLFYSKTRVLGSELLYIAGLLTLNGLILYIPQYLPGSNLDSGSLTRVDGLILGLGTALGSLPGVSGVGGNLAAASIRGMNVNKAVNLALIINIPVNLGFALYDLIDLVSGKSVGLSFSGLLGGILACFAVFGAIVIGVRLLRKLTENVGICVFGFYSWGMALLVFFLYLIAA